MKRINWRTANRRLVSVLMFGAAAFVGSGAFASNLPPAGTLTLRLGAVDQFEYAPAPGQNAQPATQAIVDKRSITNNPKDACILNLPAPPPLVAVSAGGGEPGFNFDSLGVFGGGNGSNARGVDCSRVSLGQSLTLTLAGVLSNYAVKRASLDIEVKQNARIRAVTSIPGGPTKTFELQSGSSIGASVPAGTTVVTCSAQSDSGADSGANDNCLWVIDAHFKTITFTTLVGAWSLEGGSDGAPAAPSTFELVEFTGILNCGDIATAGGPNQASVSLTRLQNVDGSSCVPIPYVLVFRSGTDLEFLKDDLGQFVATAITITWPNELAPVNTPVLNNVPLSQQQFLSTEPAVDLDLCVGTPTYVAGVFQSLAGPFPDLSSSPGVQYGCVLSRALTYPGAGIIGLKEDIYLEGDWGASRTF